MEIAILLGALAGVIGAIPLMLALRYSRKNPSTTTIASATQGLVGVFVSLIIVAVELFACSKIAHGSVLPFGIAEMLALIVVTALYMVYKVRTPKRDR